MFNLSIVYAFLAFLMIPDIGEEEEEETSVGEGEEEEEIVWEQIFPTIEEVDLGMDVMHETSNVIGSVWKSNNGMYQVVRQHNYPDVDWVTMPMETKLELATWTVIMLDVEKAESHKVEIEDVCPYELGLVSFYDEFPERAGFDSVEGRVDREWCEEFSGYYNPGIRCVLDLCRREWN